ncbi:MAG: ferredoxin [Candidatus Omnitrophica bacterium]|nr:ferredoxin [Candidatus Omnitrophota bacterium]
MKAKVNQDICLGSQDCVNACPEVFKMEGDKATVLVAEVPKDVEAKCKAAANGCPAAAISIED